MSIDWLLLGSLLELLLFFLPLLEALDEGVDEVDAGELHQGREHGGQAEDDVHVQSRGVTNFRLGFASKTQVDN